ncbi:MAG: hypothetical protein V8R50_06560 [Clostridia bacterium]
MEERLRSEKWKRYEEFLVEGEKSPATVKILSMIIQTFYLWLIKKMEIEENYRKRNSERI